MIASIIGYFLAYFVTQDLGTNLPKSIGIILPIDAPIHTARNPTKTACHVLPYAYLNARPAPSVRIEPGINKMEQIMYAKHNANGPAVG